MYRIKSSGEIKSQGEIRRLNPNTSLPRKWTDATLEGLGIDKVTISEKPDYNSATHKIVQNTEATQIDGVWTLGWSVEPMAANEIAANDVNVATNLRSSRNALLAETDYLALSDNTMSAEMATYRQALRDITAQAGFPHNVTFPTKPE
jgi:hypothetical protein